jgi:hypothetical protein
LILALAWELHYLFRNHRASATAEIFALSIWKGQL